VDLDRRDVVGSLRSLDDGRLRRCQILSGRGRGLPCDAVHRHQVRAVRHDLEVDHRIVEAERLLHVLPGLPFLQHEDARVIAGDAELARGAQHAVRRHAPELAPFELAGETG
jgi:hypothetical protein